MLNLIVCYCHSQNDVSVMNRHFFYNINIPHETGKKTKYVDIPSKYQSLQDSVILKYKSILSCSVQLCKTSIEF